MNSIPRMGGVIKAFFLINFIFIRACFAIEGDISANFIQGALQGFNQTPLGGSSGTTSFQRPSFEELNLHHDNFTSLGARFFFQDYALLFNYYHFEPQGENTLSRALITHGKPIPKGSFFGVSLNYHLYSLGLGKFVRLFNTQFLSWLEINCLKYHYDFCAYPVSSARTYNVTGLNLGLKYLYDFSSTLFADLQVSVPVFFTNLTVLKAELGINQTFNINNPIKVVPRLGLGFLRLDYKDNQPIPNHMRYTNSPYFSVGIVFLIKT